MARHKQNKAQVIQYARLSVERIRWYAETAREAADETAKRVDQAARDARTASQKADDASCALELKYDSKECQEARQSILDDLLAAKTAARAAGWKGREPW